MLKWLPFEALETQGDILRELYDSHEREEKPMLSEDQCAEIQYAVEEAYLHKKPLRIVYFENGRRLKHQGVVTGVDPINAFLFIDAQKFSFENILDAAL